MERDMFTNYLKTAWRNLLSNRMIASINIIGLSVGMTAAMLIFLWVGNEKSFDNFHPRGNDIYRVTTNLKQNNYTWESSPLLLAPLAAKQIPEIEEAARLYADHSPVFYLNNVPGYETGCAYVDDAWFRIFAYHFLEGNAASFGADPFRVILTRTEEKKYFGEQPALGKTLHIDSLSYRVQAVIADPPANSSFQYQAFFPLAALLRDEQQKSNDENWSNFNYLSFIRLKPGTAISGTEKKLTRLLPDNDHEETTITLQSLAGMHFESGIENSEIQHGSSSTVRIFSVLGFLLLLVACINYINLTTAKASLRAREVSVRKIIGASRSQLFLQFLTESLLVSLMSLAITILLIQLVLPAFNTLTEKHFVLTLTSSLIWKIAGTTLLGAFVLNSIYPALLLSSIRPLGVFRGFSLLNIKDSQFRKGLVILQFSFSVALIAGTIVIYRQMQFVQQKNPGYNRAQVLDFHVPWDLDRSKKDLLMETMKQALIARGNVEDVTMSNQSIVQIGSVSSGNADWDGHDSSFNPKIAQLSADADFLRVTGVQLKEGRWFLPGKESDRNNVILNETAIAELAIHAPWIGQRFTFKGRTGQIVGVVKDFAFKSLHSKITPLVVFKDPSWFNTYMVRIPSGRIPAAIHGMQKVYGDFFPGKPFEYQFLDESFRAMYQQDRQTSLLIFTFALIAVLISSLGLFGLATFSALQRTKEIGVRKVLGASVQGITLLLSKDFIRLVLVSIAIGIPVSLWAMQQWIEAFAYRIDLNWWMFALAGLLAIFLAVCTISFQAIRAARANPVQSLRSE